MNNYSQYTSCEMLEKLLADLFTNKYWKNINTQMNKADGVISEDTLGQPFVYCNQLSKSASTEEEVIWLKTVLFVYLTNCSQTIKRDHKYFFAFLMFIECNAEQIRNTFFDIIEYLSKNISFEFNEDTFNAKGKALPVFDVIYTLLSEDWSIFDLITLTDYGAELSDHWDAFCNGELTNNNTFNARKTTFDRTMDYINDDDTGLGDFIDD